MCWWHKRAYWFLKAMHLKKDRECGTDELELLPTDCLSACLLFTDISQCRIDWTNEKSHTHVTEWRWENRTEQNTVWINVRVRVNEVACGSLFKLTLSSCTAPHCACLASFACTHSTKYNRLVCVCTRNCLEKSGSTKRPVFCRRRRRRFSN